VPEYADYQKMKLSQADQAKLLTDIRAWFLTVKGIDILDPTQTLAAASLLTPGQQKTIAALVVGSGTATAVLKSLLNAAQ